MAAPVAYSTSNRHVKEEPIQYDRLCRAMKAASYSLMAYRMNRAKNVRDYVGNEWSENAIETPKQMVNMLRLYVDIVVKQLVAANPRMMLSTILKEAKASVGKLQTGLNKKIVKMDLAATLQRTTIDAAFGVGVTKVSLCDPGHAAKSGWEMSAGEPFAHVVDLDDFVYDTHCRDFREASFIGHRFRMPLAVAKEMKAFNKKAREALTASIDQRFQPEGDEKITSLGRAYTGDDNEFEEMVDLWEIYLPRHRLVVTLEHNTDTGASAGYDEPLRIQNWIGPYCGPYHTLGFGTVPDNAMPTNPISLLAPLNEMLNEGWRKLHRQTKRLKVITLFRGSSDKDGERIVGTSDGGSARTDDPNAVREFRMGGPDQILEQMVDIVYRTCNLVAGNMELEGGLAPQSKTLGQDKLLNENSSQIMNGLANTVTKHVASVGEAIAWYLHHDPVGTMEEEYLHPGLPKGNEIMRTLTPKDRLRIPWEKIDLQVDPYSLAYQSPGQRMQMLRGIFQEMVPVLRLLQSQGKDLDVDFYLRKMAEYGNLSDLIEMFKLGLPIPSTDAQEGQGGANGLLGGLPPGPPRESIRRSIGANGPGMAQQGIRNMQPRLGGAANGMSPEMNGRH